MKKILKVRCRYLPIPESRVQEVCRHFLQRCVKQVQRGYCRRCREGTVAMLSPKLCADFSERVLSPPFERLKLRANSVLSLSPYLCEECAQSMLPLSPSLCEECAESMLSLSSNLCEECAESMLTLSPETCEAFAESVLSLSCRTRETRAEHTPLISSKRCEPTAGFVLLLPEKDVILAGSAQAPS